MSVIPLYTCIKKISKLQVHSTTFPSGKAVSDADRPFSIHKVSSGQLLYEKNRPTGLSASVIL